MCQHEGAREPSRPRAWRTCLALLSLWVAAWSTSATAEPSRHEPSLHVRAATRLELHTRRAAGALRIEGVLADDLDQPLGSREVRLSAQPLPPLAASPAATPVPGPQPTAADPAAADARRADDAPAAAWARTLRTDAEGRFGQALPLAQGRYRVVASHPGDALHAASSSERTVDATLADVTLQLVLPRGRTISLDEPQLEVEVHARCELGAGGLTFMLLDQDRRSLAHGMSDAEGVWRATVPSDALGEPGPGTLSVISAPDAERAPARTESAVLRQRATQLSASARWDEPSESLRIHGELRAGKLALAGKAVGLFLSGQHIQTVRTDAQGRFAHAARAADDPSGQLGRAARSAEQVQHVSARFDSDTPGLAASHAPEQPVLVPAWVGPSVLWLALPSLASLLAAWLILRRNRAWLGPVARSETFEAGVQLGATTRDHAAREHGLSGVVEDADTAGALASASLRLVPLAVAAGGPGPAIPAAVAPDGRFAIAVLPAGHYRLEAGAPGYALESSELRIPHAGEGAGLRVRLRSLRTLALEAHRPLVRRVFATRQAQIAATPREALQRATPLWPPASSPAAPRLSAQPSDSGQPDRARPGAVEPRAPARELSELTVLVEETAFSAAEPTPEQVDAIERTTRELLKRSV